MTHPSQEHEAHLQLQRARELLAQGQHQEALILALDALQKVLAHLRTSLLNLQRNLAQVQKDGARVEASKEELEALMKLHRERKTRIYH